MRFDQYTAKRAELISHLEELAALNDSFNNIAIKEELIQCRQALAQDNFRVVVVGRFSRGKSTFVNALLGRRVLPTSKKPTTAVISKISYGAEPKFTIHYKNNLQEAVNEDEFFAIKAPKFCDSYSTAEEVADNLAEQAKINDIDYVEVAYPLEFCKHAVELIDTPGTDDLNQSRIEITYKYLNQADAVILLLAADQALSIGEVEFLQERILKHQIRDIFYIINRKDTLNGPDEEERVRQFVKEHLGHILQVSPEAVTPYLVSSYQALLFRRQAAGETLTAKQLRQIPDDFQITGFGDFEAALQKYLSEEKGRKRLALYGRKIMSSIDTMIADSHTRLALLDHSTDEIKAVIQALAAEQVKIKTHTDAVLKQTKRGLEAYTDSLQERCQLGLQNITKSLQDLVNAYEGDVTDCNINNVVQVQLTKRQKQLVSDLQEYISQAVAVEYRSAAKALQALWNNFDESYTQVVPTALTSLLPMNALANMDKLEQVGKASMEADENSDGAINLGATVGGVVIAIATGSFIPVALGFGLAALLESSEDSRQYKAKQLICEQIQAHMEQIHTQLETNLLSIYRATCDNILTSLRLSVDARLHTVGVQLADSLRIKEEQETERALQREAYKGRIRDLQDRKAYIAKITL